MKLKNLPAYHGKPVMEVELGKGQKLRTVSVSEWFALGHKAETSQIYSKTLSEKVKSSMNKFHADL